LQRNDEKKQTHSNAMLANRILRTYYLFITVGCANLNAVQPQSFSGKRLNLNQLLPHSRNCTSSIAFPISHVPRCFET
jgi:hypothetical protein